MLNDNELFPPTILWSQVQASIFANKKAVYGYSPRPDSISIGIYADQPWEDKSFVAYAKKVRIQYRKELTEMYRLAEKMYLEGSNDEAVARKISSYRNEERLHAYMGNPEMMFRFLENSRERYGTERGLAPEAAYKKYRSWKLVLEKSLSINLGMDVCCGLCKVIGFPE